MPLNSKMFAENKDIADQKEMKMQVQMGTLSPIVNSVIIRKTNRHGLLQ